MLDALRDVLHHVMAGVNQTELENEKAKLVKNKVYDALQFMDQRLRNTQHKVYGKQDFTIGDTVEATSPGGQAERVVIRNYVKNDPAFDGLNMYQVQKRAGDRTLVWVVSSDLRKIRTQR